MVTNPCSDLKTKLFSSGRRVQEQQVPTQQLYLSDEVLLGEDWLISLLIWTTHLPPSKCVSLSHCFILCSLRYYGCGLVIPECLEDCWILDLGCGSGRDCYMLSKMVGENGHVTGVDMTESQVRGCSLRADSRLSCLPSDC